MSKKHREFIIKAFAVFAIVGMIISTFASALTLL